MSTRMPRSVGHHFNQRIDNEIHMSSILSRISYVSMQVYNLCCLLLMRTITRNMEMGGFEKGSPTTHIILRSHEKGG